eukprot:scaffold5749_cov104-Isochrysis_galbana.AAC.1
MLTPASACGEGAKGLVRRGMEWNMPYSNVRAGASVFDFDLRCGCEGGAEYHPYALINSKKMLKRKGCGEEGAWRNEAHRGIG